ncbi:DUF167 domain-containing protein [Chloroflexota bacterium]
MKEEQATIIVQVQPNASRNEVIRFESGVWYLRIAAPPIKGKANRELIKFLSGILGISRDNIIIKKGMSSKRKIIVIQDITQQQVMERLQN